MSLAGKLFSCRCSSPWAASMDLHMTQRYSGLNVSRKVSVTEPVCWKLSPAIHPHATTCKTIHGSLIASSAVMSRRNGAAFFTN